MNQGTSLRNLSDSNMSEGQVNQLLPTHRQTLGSQRATGGTIPTFNRDCVAHRGRRIKRCSQGYRNRKRKKRFFNFDQSKPKVASRLSGLRHRVSNCH